MTTQVACPSPPWSASGGLPSPPWSASGGLPSPPGQLLVVCLLLLVRDCSTLPWSSASMVQSMEYIGWCSSVSWCCVQEQWCSCDCPVLVEWAASPWPSWSTLAAAALLCCGADSTTPSQGDWAACKQLLCLPTRLDLILTTLSLPLTLWMLKCWVHIQFVPMLKEQILNFVKYTRWCNGKIICPSLRVNSLTPNLLLCFFVLCFCRLHLMKIQKIISMKIIRYSLVLGFFLFISDVIFFLCNKYVKTLYWCIISIKYYLCLFYILFPFLLFN
jgi:hypothetical protein